ncbi:ion transporter [Azonexus sp. IMCC34839]|uniref:ion transporter n=1 Tax=Azonexus sp. IMCC34839 TaxID=3133695 RepID=UPI003999E1DE
MRYAENGDFSTYHLAMDGRLPHQVLHQTVRQSVFHVLHKPLPNSRVARYVNYALALLILSNCAAVALETVPSINQTHQSLLFWLEAISTSVFVVEYMARLWVCVEQTRLSHPVFGRVRYVFQPLPLLDFIVIATYFAPVDLRFLRIFRLTRLLRVLHLDSFDYSMQRVGRAIGQRKHLLVMSVALMLIAVYCLAALLFMVEHSVQPDKFSSIPETLWWAVVTLTTIGYGDITPITPLGKLLAGAGAIFGIGIFALPTAVMTAAILDAGTDAEANCPHCGHRLDS